MVTFSKKLLVSALKIYHDSMFTPGVYEHSIFGQAALLLEKDAVEVVRCKDCKHYRFNSCYREVDRTEAWMAENGITFSHNAPIYSCFNKEDFCSYGEKR